MPTPEGPCVLVVEDDEDSALLMEEILRERGFVVEVAHDGASALEVAARVRPDLGLLDLGLPDMDGFELAQKLRALPEVGTHIRLIALSGYGSDEDVRKAHECGFNLHMTKPVPPSALAKALEAQVAAQAPQLPDVG